MFCMTWILQGCEPMLPHSWPTAVSRSQERHLPPENLGLHIQELQALLQAAENAFPLGKPGVLRCNPFRHDHHGQTASIAVKLADPCIQRPQFRRLHPPWDFIREPQTRCIEVLLQPPPGMRSLSDIADVPDIPWIGERIDR